MAVKNSETIERLVATKGKQKFLRGFTLGKAGVPASSLRVYPTLSLGSYFEVDEDHVDKVIGDGKGGEEKTLLLKDDAEVALVTRTPIPVSDLDDEGGGPTAERAKQNPLVDRLRLYLLLGNEELLKMYLGTELIPGTGKSGSPEELL
ncbi:hypothetical protein [Erythrobacter rubeus]|uniref:Uncharacterized protein n=1 Tax=Erythrobacter rubeus TaxID=2760803 RepID=A0ABR8KP63_9SPHN|nr:hypothetical protein [Erythrobacter rubeus]MBD2842439.1 hypothetical protein [Erythrobacter rubeus]